MSAANMEIVLTSSPGPIHVVSSDQIITGKLLFSNKKDRPSGIVIVSLVGHAEVTFSKARTVYYGISTLFTSSNTLLEGPLSPKDYEWPFEFTFPKVTGAQDKKWKDIPPFQVTDGHALPPSMMFDLEGDGRDSGKGGVIYTLEASLTKDSKSPKALESLSQVLFYIPSRKTSVPDPRTTLIGKESFTCSSKLLEAPGEKPKSFFKKFKTPTSIFEVAIAAPLVVYIGGPLPITLSLKHDLANSTASQTPTVTLTSCTVTLLRTVHATGRAIFEDEGKFFAAEALLEATNLSIPLASTQDLSSLLPLPEFKTKYGMSFATYNLVQTFKIMVTITLECAEKRFRTELRSKNVWVLSPFTKEELDMGKGDPEALIRGMHRLGPDYEGVANAGADLLLGALGIASLFM